MIWPGNTSTLDLEPDAVALIRNLAGLSSQLPVHADVVMLLIPALVLIEVFRLAKKLVS